MGQLPQWGGRAENRDGGSGEMSKSDAAIAARQKANQLFEEAQDAEARTGQPDGAAYKAAAEAFKGALLLEMNSARMRASRNSVEDKVKFLRSFVKEDKDRKSLSVDYLATRIATEHEVEAQKYWPGKRVEELRRVIRNFLSQKGRHKQILGALFFD